MNIKNFSIIAIIFFYSTIMAFATDQFGENYFSQQEEPVFRWVRLSDLIDYKSLPFEINFKNKIEEEINKELETNLGKMEWLRFQTLPRHTSDSELIVNTVSYFSRSKSKGHYVSCEVIFDIQDGTLSEINIQKVTALSDTKFQVRIGINQLKMVVEDKENVIKLLFPIG